MYWTKIYNGRRLIFNVADNIRFNFQQRYVPFCRDIKFNFLQRYVAFCPDLFCMLMHVCNSEYFV